MESPSPADGTLRTRLRRQEVVTDLGRRALETDDPEGFLRDATATVAETVAAEHCVVLESRPDGTGIIRAGVGRVGETVPMASDTHVGTALRAGRTVATAEPSTEGGAAVAEFVADRAVTGAVGVPVGTDDDPWGVLAAYATGGEPVTDADVDFLERVADLLEPAVENVRTRRDLAASERRYRTLVDHFPNGAVALVDEDLTYRTVGGEPAAGSTTAAEMEGEPVADAVPQPLADDLVPRYAAALEGEASAFEATARGRVYDFHVVPVRDDDGEPAAALGMSQDVTEQVERERELERYETIVEVIDDGVYVVDADGYFTMVNETYASMLGYEPADLVDEHVSTVVDDAVIDRIKQLESDATAGELPTIEAPVRTADGDVIPMEASFAMLPADDDSSWHRVGVARDVSERKAWERELEESERRYRTLVENFPDGAVGLYDESLEYLVVGGEAFDELRIAESEVVGTTLAERYRDDLVAEIEPHFRAVFDGESNTFEYRAYGRDVRAHTLPVRNEDGEIFAGMVMAQDVTERREYERKLEQSNERLEQFAYAASHDLQEPLRMITSYLTLLEQRYGDSFDEDGEEFLEYAVDGAERMQAMIDGLLEYSRVETRGDPFEPTDLNAVLEDVLADLQVRIEETDAEITVGDLPRLEADASQLRQVFQNLLENALTYSGDEPPRVRVDAERRGDEWEIAVRDEGIGIGPDDQDRIFEVFERLHGREEYEGAGIGLALCERIVERHGGEIAIDSEPGEGTTVSVVLPISPE